MSTKPARLRNRAIAGHGAFYVGMSLIAAVTVLNIAYDRIARVGPEVMPPFLSHLYDTSGKTGVTIIFVAFGLSVILLGVALSGGRQARQEPARSRANSPDPLLCPPADGEGEPDVTSSGTVVLRTRKYVAPDCGLSGATGWAPPRRT